MRRRRALQKLRLEYPDPRLRKAARDTITRRTGIPNGLLPAPIVAAECARLLLVRALRDARSK